MAHQRHFTGTLLLSASVGLFVGLTSLSAQATVCKSDADCTGGAVCVVGVVPTRSVDAPTSVGSAVADTVGVSTGGSADGGNASSGSGGSSGSTVGDVKPAPDPMPTVSVGYCRMPPTACKTTAECPADYTCYRPLIATPCSAPAPRGGSTGSATPTDDGGGATSGGSSGSGGSTGGSTGAGATSGSTDPIAVPPDYPTKCDSTPVESESGYCQPAPHACKAASDCPAPLTCAPTTCTGGDCPSSCTFTPTTCTADSDCADPNTECATVSKSSWCSGSAVPVCAKDEVCTPVAPTPPVCGTSETKQCMPKRIDCSAGESCPAGWSCYDSSDHAMSAPSWWNVTGPIKVCMPDGIIMAVDGHAEGSYTLHFSGGSYGSWGAKDGAVSTGGNSGGTATIGVSPHAAGSTGNQSSETAPASPSPVNTTDVTQSVASSDTGTGAVAAPQAEAAGGGCSFGGSSSGAWGLVLTGLAFVLSMRRRARR